MSKKYKNKKWLQQKYTVEKKSTPEIGKILNCAPVTIRNWLKTLNIPRRTLSEAKMGNKDAYRPLEERFWEKVDKNGLNGCWIWTRSLNRGYGRIDHKGAHVVSWELHNGRKVKDGYVLHHKFKCGNKKCVNPMHLQEMTEAEHLSLHNSGENNPNSKLTEKIVLEIRADWATGKYTQQQLAEKYDVSRSLIGLIVNRKIWTHI